MTIPPVAWLFVIVAGACLGSYVATAALRLADGRQSTFGRSACDHCGVSLSWVRTTPVVSYARQRGACTSCGGRIDPLHLGGEVVGATLAVTVLMVDPTPRGLLLGIVGFLLLASAIHDAKTHRLPDGLTLGIALGCVALAATNTRTALVASVLTAGATFVVMEAVRRVFLHLRGRPALGFGDVKLAAALALWTGLGTPWVVALAAILGLASTVLYRPPAGRLAFGPYIAVAAWTVGLLEEAGRWPTFA